MKRGSASRFASQARFRGDGMPEIQVRPSKRWKTISIRRGSPRLPAGGRDVDRSAPGERRADGVVDGQGAQLRAAARISAFFARLPSW